LIIELTQTIHKKTHIYQQQIIQLKAINTRTHSTRVSSDAKILHYNWFGTAYYHWFTI